ncbi:unnamed protein product [Amoebophrya sp. A120]|nr:unnamed protein product [Amoebophrya sp. A120]|eukprot:GSA120T00024877001.1
MRPRMVVRRAKDRFWSFSANMRANVDNDILPMIMGPSQLQTEKQ